MTFRLLIILMWAGFSYLTLNILTKDKVDESMLTSKTGVVISAECYVHRNSSEIEYRAIFNGEKIEYSGILRAYCDEETIQMLLKNMIVVTFYKDKNIAATVNDIEIVSVEKGLERINGTLFLIISTFFLCAVLTFFYHLWSRPIT